MIEETCLLGAFHLTIGEEGLVLFNGVDETHLGAFSKPFSWCTIVQTTRASLEFHNAIGHVNTECLLLVRVISDAVIVFHFRKTENIRHGLAVEPCIAEVINSALIVCGQSTAIRCQTKWLLAKGDILLVLVIAEHSGC